jgi:hypothetical protein
VFEKVFSEDIERLRSMGDLWKSRKPPTALDYDALSAQAAGVKTSVARIDQRIWSLEENFVVFSDRSGFALSCSMAVIRYANIRAASDVWRIGYKRSRHVPVRLIRRPYYRSIRMTPTRSTL